MICMVIFNSFYFIGLRDSNVATTCRRNSNASTLGSQASSIRSDSSPCRSSQNSQQSFAHSPSEYDIASSPPTSQGSNNMAGNVGALAFHMERTRLSGGSSIASDQCERGSITRFFLASCRESSDSGIRTNTCASSPCETPLLQGLSNCDVRRASDPVHAHINENAPLPARPFQRCHSLTAVRPLPIPPKLQPFRKTNTQGSQNLMSSRSSIATNISSVQSVDTDIALTVPKTESEVGNPMNGIGVEDLIIPDDMQEFIDENFSSASAPVQADSTIPEQRNEKLSDNNIKCSYENKQRSSCMYEKASADTRASTGAAAAAGPNDTFTWNQPCIADNRNVVNAHGSSYDFAASDMSHVNNMSQGSAQNRQHIDMSHANNMTQGSPQTMQHIDMSHANNMTQGSAQSMQNRQVWMNRQGQYANDAMHDMNRQNMVYDRQQQHPQRNNNILSNNILNISSNILSSSSNSSSSSSSRGSSSTGTTINGTHIMPTPGFPLGISVNIIRDISTWNPDQCLQHRITLTPMFRFRKLANRRFHQKLKRPIGRFLRTQQGPIRICRCLDIQGSIKIILVQLGITCSIKTCILRCNIRTTCMAIMIGSRATGPLQVKWVTNITCTRSQL